MSSAMKIIESSKYLESSLIENASANCFTILNILGFNFTKLNFSNCKLSGANLENLDLSKCKFDNCYFQNVNFTNTIQENISFENSFCPFKIVNKKQSNKPFQTSHINIKQLVITSDGIYIIYNSTESYDIIVFDAQKQQIVAELKSHKSKITMMCKTRDDQYLCSSDSTQLLLWDLNKKAVISTISISSTFLMGSFFYDMTKLVLGSVNKITYIYDCSKQELVEIYQLTKHTAQVYAVSCSEKDGIFASAADDYYIYIWNSDSIELCHMKSSQLTNSIVFSTDGLWLFSGHTSGKLTIWNTKEGSEKCSVTLSGNIYDCYYINKNKNVIFTQDNNKVSVYKSSNLEEDFSLTLLTTKFIMTQDDKKGLVALKNGGLQYLDLKKPQKLQKKVFLPQKNTHLFFGKIQFSGDGKILAIYDENLIILDFENGLDLIQEIIDKSIVNVSLNYTGQFYAYCDEIQTSIKINEIKDNNNPIIIQTSEFITQLCYSNDDTMLLSGGKGKQINIWNPLNGNLLNSLESEQLGEINAIFISQDNQKIYAIGSQNKLHIWKGYELHCVIDNQIEVQKMFITQNENYIIFKLQDLTYQTYQLSISDKKIIQLPEKNIIQIISSDETLQLSSNKEGIFYLEGLQNSKYQGKSQQLNNLQTDIIQFSPDNKYLITGDDEKGFNFYNIEQELNKENSQSLQKNELTIYEKIDSGINFKLKDKFMGYQGPFYLRSFYSVQGFKLSEFKHPNIENDGKYIAKSVKENGYKIAIFEPCLNGSSGQGNKNRRFAYKILKSQSGWLGCGICHKQTIINNKYEFKYSQLGHGAYMITCNAGTWSNHISDQNNQVKAFNFDKGDTIICDYLPSQLKLKFSKMDQKNVLQNETYTLDLKFSPDKLYHPCVIFYYAECSIEFINKI